MLVLYHFELRPGIIRSKNRLAAKALDALTKWTFVSLTTSKLRNNNRDISFYLSDMLYHVQTNSTDCSSYRGCLR